MPRKTPRDKRSKRYSLSAWLNEHRRELRRYTFEKAAPGREWRRTVRYRVWRSRVLKAAGHRCLRCGSTGPLDAHHVIPASVCTELRFVEWNGQALCKSCHERIPHRADPEYWRRRVRGK